MGLEPFRQWEPSLYQKWDAIRRGEIERPSQLIKNDFSARWVICPRILRFGRAIKAFYTDSGLEEAYTDKNYSIYRVL
jgi:hypothetical protein